MKFHHFVFADNELEAMQRMAPYQESPDIESVGGYRYMDRIEEKVDIGEQIRQSRIFGFSLADVILRIDTFYGWKWRYNRRSGLHVVLWYNPNARWDYFWVMDDEFNGRMSVSPSDPILDEMPYRVTSFLSPDGWVSVDYGVKIEEYRAAFQHARQKYAHMQVFICHCHF